MIYAVIAAETHVSRRDAEVLQEWCVVRAGPKRTDPGFGVIVRIGFVSLFKSAILPLLINGFTCLRIFYLARRGANQFPKRRNGGRAIIWPVHSDIHIQISNRFFLQLEVVLLCPFSRTDQAIFFRVPTTQDNRPARLPTILD